MSRKKRKIKARKTQPDNRYSSELVRRFINKMMLEGKESIASRIMYRAMDMAAEKVKKPALEVLNKAIENVKPVLEVKPRRVGGATYQVPVEVGERRGVDLAMRWIIQFARLRKGKPMFERLAGELIDAVNGEGSAIKKKQDTHKMAESNRAFAHYRW